MDDRREWVASYVERIASELGIKPLSIKFQESKRHRNVELAQVEFDASKTGKELRELELYVSPAALESMPEKELVYRVTLALVFASRKGIPMEGALMLAFLMVLPITAAMAVSIVTVGSRFSPMLGALTLVVMVPVAVALLTLYTNAISRKCHLEAIQITGDALTPLHILNEDAVPLTTKYLAFLSPRQGKDSLLRSSIAKAAVKRGFRIEPEVDA
jgi:hypothetical protein